MAIRSSKRIVVADAHTKTGKKASACEHREGRKVLFPHRPPTSLNVYTFSAVERPARRGGGLNASRKLSASGVAT